MAEGSTKDYSGEPDSATNIPRLAKRGRRLVLCLDGTGKAYKGDGSDTNIVKIFHMLDRKADDQFHYYQRMPATGLPIQCYLLDLILTD